jgi:hypothetical protein
VKIPIRWSLDAGDARAQLKEWQQLLGRVDHQDRVSSTRLELSPLDEFDIAELVQLARREVACCPFFTFTIEIGHERLVLAIEVPDEAVEVLDELIAGARPTRG